MLCLDPNGRARARAANAVRVPAGMFSLIADSGVILFVSGVSNLIVSIGYFHSDNNTFVCLLGNKLTKKRDYFFPGSRSWSNANEILLRFLMKMNKKRDQKMC
mmetsp:Transcript_15599/g.32084  ORF Transcript_15599/g.32084 Transcript_15599/m.32084 type:complete len:103 (+) Transcript_15599:58-366(+)